MRRKIPGARKSPLVHACQWPRSIYVRQGHLGGLKTAKITEAIQQKDLIEVREYLAVHPTATITDVAMCCFMSDSQAQRLRRKVLYESR